MPMSARDGGTVQVSVCLKGGRAGRLPRPGALRRRRAVLPLGRPPHARAGAFRYSWTRTGPVGPTAPQAAPSRRASEASSQGQPLPRKYVVQAGEHVAWGDEAGERRSDALRIVKEPAQVIVVPDEPTDQGKLVQDAVDLGVDLVDTAAGSCGQRDVAQPPRVVGHVLGRARNLA